MVFEERVSKLQALEVLKLVKETYPESATEFHLYDYTQEDIPPGHWSINADLGWDWVYDFTDYPPPGMPEGVGVQPNYTWSITVHPDRVSED